MSLNEVQVGTAAPAAGPKPATGPVVKFDGMNNARERDASEVRVKLNSRVILSPFAAKRLGLLLNSVVQQYEARFGAMDVGIAQTDRATK